MLPKLALLVGLTLCLSFICAASASAQTTRRGFAVSRDVSEADMVDMKDWGANVIRIPFCRRDITQASRETEAEFQDELQGHCLPDADAAVALAAQYNLGVVLEIGTPPGGFGPSGMRIFTDKWAQDALVWAWNAIAAHFAGNSTVWAYELVNEPAERKVTKGLKNWQVLALQTALAVRAADGVHPIIVDTKYGNPLLKLKPLPVGGIVYSAHMYNPFNYTHQGLYGKPLGLSYNKKAALKALQPFLRFCKRGQACFVGELGVARWAPGNYNYLTDVIDLLEAAGIDWAYHAWEPGPAPCPWAPTMSSDMRDLRIQTTDREMLLRQYFSRNR